MSGDDIVRIEEGEIERFLALGLGPYDAIVAVEAGVDWHAVEQLVRGQGCAPAVALARVR